MNFIPDEDVEKALDWLRRSAMPAAKARAERQYVEDYLKVLKATLMQEHARASNGSKSGIEQERDALADPRYLQHLDAIREAVEKDCEYTFLRGAAETKMSAWQTMHATERAMKL